jgi:stage V sporulation protein G
VIRDLKIIDGSNGPFVAMPSRKLTAHCPSCGCKNHLRAPHCNQCGGRLSDDRLVKDEDGRAKLYADIAHPINSACREMIQHRVIQEFHLEMDRGKLPGYRSRYDDYDHDAETSAPAERRSRDSDSHARKTQVQPAESTPRSPHKMSHAPAPRSTSNVPATHTNVSAPHTGVPAAHTGVPVAQTGPVAQSSGSAPHASGPHSPPAQPGIKRDGFGAGIF